MDTLASVPSPDLREVADLDLGEAAEAGPLRARFILVEDVDHLLRSGESRQVLAMRWAR